MEKILQEVLNELKELKKETSDRFDKLEAKVDKLGTKIDDIEAANGAKHIEIPTKLNTLCDDVKFIKHKQFQNEQELFHLRTRLETNEKLDSIIDKLNAVEAVTKENLYDIAKLKLIK
ncbi:hypothetical protein CACET_c15310 [Clostridium aceticum]|uniref:Uncharacterized protein n=1 Tax=Clostridium aceticum TaxID=84022 RepID=A0A0D8ICT2_9CLOT|nr:hypothetical protein [Clostridium aceticum]AKL94980.1 hypothetical protein CACET_c15310 [Clostridium aceticum]KJF27889.1 hypothetical protein TZ02_04735 [Clostridium aceticum]